MRIEITKTPDKLVATFRDTTYDAANDLRRRVTASRYAKQFSDRANGSFAFTYPLSPDKCTEMREAWGNSLKVHRTVSEWYRLARQLREAQVENTVATDAELVRVPALYPELNEWLKPDQRVTAKWIANAYRGAGLLADEVGTGKTAGVVAGLVEADIAGPTLVVCPKISVRRVWFHELTRHTNIPVYACHGARKNREKVIAAFLADPSQFKVLVVVVEMLRIKAVRSQGRIEEFLGYEYPDLFDVQWSCVVVDESQRLLGSMDVVRANLAGDGMRDLKYASKHLKLAVSATPFGKGGRTEALFGTLHWLWKDEFPSRWAWLRKYFDVYEDQVFVRGGGGATKAVQRVGKILNEKELWQDLGPRVLRRTMEEVSPEHRGLKNFVEVLCDMDPTQAKQYRQFAEDGELAVNGGIISSVGVLDFLTRCRQFANGMLVKEGGRVRYNGVSGKLDQLMLHIEQLSPNRKLVIASQYNEFLDAVEKRLQEAGEGYYRMDGRTTDKRREDIMNAFQSDPVFKGPGITCGHCHTGQGKPHGRRCPDGVDQLGHRVFLLNSQAGGVSITLDAADELHALDEMYPPEANEQLYGRIFRRGRVHQVFFYLYRSVGTIDERIGYNVAANREEQARILDGRRGLDYARELAQYRRPGKE